MQPVAPRARRANSTKGQATFNHVLATSVQLFAEKGYAATSMRELARRADLPISAFYYYFATKYDVLIGIIEIGMQSLHDHVTAAVDPSAPAADRLTQLVIAHVERHLAEPLTAHVADNEIRSLNDDDRERVLKQRRSYEELFRKVLRDGVESGDFAADLDVNFAGNLVLTMATGVIYWFKPGGKKSQRRTAETVAHYALRMVS